jgi:hypothetical protein
MKRGPHTTHYRSWDCGCISILEYYGAFWMPFNQCPRYPGCVATRKFIGVKSVVR